MTTRLKALVIDLPDKLGGGYGLLVGGPFNEAAELYVNSFKVNLEQNIKKPADVTLDVPDFSIPANPEAFDNAIVAAAQALADGKVVVAGCRGGIGRTGIFLATLVGALRLTENPVPYLRSIYLPHTVETSQQGQFIEERFRALRKRIDAEVRFRMPPTPTTVPKKSEGLFSSLLRRFFGRAAA